MAWSNCGRERAAAIYSLLGATKLNGINPERYLPISSSSRKGINAGVDAGEPLQEENQLSTAIALDTEDRASFISLEF